MLKRQYLDQNPGVFRFLIQTRDQAHDNGQRFLGGSNDQGVGSGIDDDVGLILGSRLSSGLPLEKILDDVLDGGCIGMLQRINLD